MARKIQINISNKVFYTLITLSLIIIFGVVVYAYGTSSPSVVGHSAGEIEGVCLSDGTNCPSRTVDTRCDSSGTCSQLCIGTNCRASWPGSITGGVNATAVIGCGGCGCDADRRCELVWTNGILTQRWCYQDQACPSGGY